MAQHVAPGQWKQPKFFELGQWESCIMEIGSPDIVSSGWGERSHKDVKAAFKHTNKHNRTIQRQVRYFAGLTIVPTQSKGPSVSDGKAVLPCKHHGHVQLTCTLRGGSCVVVMEQSFSDSHQNCMHLSPTST